MKKTIFWSLVALLTMGITLTSCSSDDDPIIINEPVSLTLEMPLGIQNVEVLNDMVVLTNVNNNKTIVRSNAIQKTADGFVASFEGVEEGSYNVEASGTLTFTVDGVEGTSPFEVKQDNVVLSLSKTKIKVTINTFTAKGGFVLSEIFFTGTTTPEGKQYSNDQYLIITNNSDVTLYADQLAICESSFLSTTNYRYVPDTNNEIFAVDALYVIPGSGNDVPVEPGKSLTIAVNAINHTEANANSFDLSNADFEFYDETSNPNYADVDNQQVPNLDKWFCYTATLYSFHNRGFRAMALAKMQTTKEDWLANYAYEGKYIMTFNGTDYEMDVVKTYKVPMGWLIDGVNLSVETEWQWNVLPASIDSGWTYCGKLLSDKDRYNKAVIRKTTDDGKYVDTNNSTNDFNAETTPSRLAQ